MEIKPHPNSPEKALVTPEDLLEATLLAGTIPPHRAAIDFYRPYRDIREAQIDMIAGIRPEPIVLSHRQLRWIGKRIAPWEKPITRFSGREEIDKRHNAAQAILDYFGVRLAKGG